MSSTHAGMLISPAPLPPKNVFSLRLSEAVVTADGASESENSALSIDDCALVVMQTRCND